MSEIITEDGETVGIQDRVLCYYATPIQWGTVLHIDADGWATVRHDDGTNGSYNGERLAVRAPSLGPAAIGPDPQAPTTCARCDQPIGETGDGTWCNFGAVPVAGHRAALCPDGIHTHAPA